MKILIASRRKRWPSTAHSTTFTPDLSLTAALEFFSRNM